MRDCTGFINTRFTTSGVDAGVEHINGDGDAWQVVLLEFGDETVAIAAVAHSLGRGRDDLRKAHRDCPDCR
jgi:hypothetical protein